ncbi:hypothetical protein FRC10_010182 [Ceratobasidium sp. 414]|nr:hypothetical protein FRC10_010182 [Ceratobasidium sp. 414]
MSSELDYSASYRISVNAAEQDHRIRSVTVFQTDRAEVKRRVVVELKVCYVRPVKTRVLTGRRKRGQNYVDIERLPSCINEDSIHVEGTGSAVIFDVIYHDPASVQKSSSTLLDDSPAAVCHRELYALEQERDIAREQFKFLSSYGFSLDSKVTNSEEMARFLDMFGPRQSSVAKRLQELDIQIARARKEYGAQKKVYESGHSEKRCTKVSVVVLAENDGRAELMLTYVVSHASWTPLYDVHASVGKSKGPSSALDLHYRASITQTTGEDWSNVKLTLSTASPQLGIAIPTLSPWRVGRVQPRSRRARSRSYSPVHPMIIHARSRRSRSRSRSHSPTRVVQVDCYRRGRSRSPATGMPAPAYSPPRIRAPSPMRWRDVQAVSTDALNTTFTIPGRSNIPSDETSHKVVIQVLHLQAGVEWICIPSKQLSVFLKCNVVNTSEFALLPGVARVFLDSNFVAKTRMEHVAPNDSFKISLGSDPALRVTYPPVRTLNHTTPQSTFLSRKEDANRNIATYSQRITIRNPSSTIAPGLHVYDHVPVSTDTVITVKVLLPSGLGPVVLPANEGTGKRNSKSRDWVQIRQGLKARWAPLDMGGEGTVEWLCDLGVAEEIELELSWEVSAPVGEIWI